MEYNMQEALTFSMVDADNKCTISEEEGIAALQQMGVPEEEMGSIMDVLGAVAGDDGQMSFDEFKVA